MSKSNGGRNKSRVYCTFGEHFYRFNQDQDHHTAFTACVEKLHTHLKTTFPETNGSKHDRTPSQHTTTVAFQLGRQGDHLAGPVTVSLADLNNGHHSVLRAAFDAAMEKIAALKPAVSEAAE